MAPRKRMTRKSDIEKQAKAKAALENALKNKDLAADVEKKGEPASDGCGKKTIQAAKSISDKRQPVDQQEAGQKDEPEDVFTHIFEINDSQVNTKDVAWRIYEACGAEGTKTDQIGNMDIYYNFAERRAYYVIDGKAEGRYVDF